MMRRRVTDVPRYGPCCGEQLEYIGYYRCPGCTQRVEIGVMVRPDEAARTREERARAAATANGQSEGAGSDRLF